MSEPPRKKQKKEKKKKEKKEKKRSSDEISKSSDENKPLVISPIAQPLADAELTKKCLKLVKKVAKADSKKLRRGVKECVKYIRKDEKGLCLIAGDISPIDVITHLPILCEEADIPYVYVPSKAELGSAAMTKRPTSCVLIKVEKGSSLYDLFNECVKELPKPNF
eukprot:g9223.t1